jgi:hypothetical protein
MSIKNPKKNIKTKNVNIGRLVKIEIRLDEPNGRLSAQRLFDLTFTLLSKAGFVKGFSSDLFNRLLNSFSVGLARFSPNIPIKASAVEMPRGNSASELSTALVPAAIALRLNHEKSDGAALFGGELAHAELALESFGPAFHLLIRAKSLVGLALGLAIRAVFGRRFGSRSGGGGRCGGHGAKVRVRVDGGGMS